MKTRTSPATFTEIELDYLLKGRDGDEEGMYSRWVLAADALSAGFVLSEAMAADERRPPDKLLTVLGGVAGSLEMVMVAALIVGSGASWIEFVRKQSWFDGLNGAWTTGLAYNRSRDLLRKAQPPKPEPKPDFLERDRFLAWCNSVAGEYAQKAGRLRSLIDPADFNLSTEHDRAAYALTKRGRHMIDNSKFDEDRYSSIWGVYLPNSARAAASPKFRTLMHGQAADVLLADDELVKYLHDEYGDLGDTLTQCWSLRRSFAEQELEIVAPPIATAVTQNIAQQTQDAIMSRPAPWRAKGTPRARTVSFSLEQVASLS